MKCVYRVNIPMYDYTIYDGENQDEVVQWLKNLCDDEVEITPTRIEETRVLHIIVSRKTEASPLLMHFDPGNYIVLVGTSIHPLTEDYFHKCFAVVKTVKEETPQGVFSVIMKSYESGEKE